MILALLSFVLHVFYFVGAVIAIFFASLAVGRTIEVRVNRFRARRELAEVRKRPVLEPVEQSRDWRWPPTGYPKAEYVAPLGKTRVGIRRKP